MMLIDGPGIEGRKTLAARTSDAADRGGPDREFTRLRPR